MRDKFNRQPIISIPYSLHMRPVVMQEYHRHNEIEVNFLEHGSMTYLFSTGRHTVAAGNLAIFWATFPHRVIYVTGDPIFYCLHIPLAYFLQWNIPGEMANHVLHGRVVTDMDSSHETLDRAQFPLWHNDLTSHDKESAQTVMLELHARLRRLSLVAPKGLTKTKPDIYAALPDTNQFLKVEKMASYISEHYTDEISIDDIAEVASLHPKYAMTLFRHVFGLTIGEYISQHRLSHAQRLLAITDLKIVDVALEAGFGSVSQFYELFSQTNKMTPTQFRALARNIG